MTHNLPPSRFAAGTTYAENARYIVTPEVAPAASSRAVRSVGETALQGVIRPGFLQSIAENAQHKIEAQKNQEQAHLQQVFDVQRAEKMPNDITNPKLWRWTVTEKSQSDAAHWQELVEDDIKAIIDQYSNDSMTAKERVDLVRQNQELRISLGAYLLRKIDAMADNGTAMPERIRANMGKNTPIHGYDVPMSNREVAAVYAVSMLDGTFKEEIAPDDFYRDNQGNVKIGQHRYAASSALRARGYKK